jgi:hypothetical protein
MRSNYLKETLKTAVLAVTILLLGVGVSAAQVNLIAGPSNLITPDGASVPMWGYSCGVVSAPTTCAKLNGSTTGWAPVVITIPTGSNLNVTLTNNLTFGANKIPTSLVIVGQLGGGLGTTPTAVASPDHTNAQPLTWPIAGDGPGQPLSGVGVPPVQGTRVQSFSSEVAAGTTSATLTWTTPRPGTYLIESGTHPSIQGPMGLYGILVVTAAPSGTTAGTAYPAVTGGNAAVTYNAEIPLLLSEIDPVQNNAVQTAVNTAGFTETAVWSGLPGGCGNPSSPTYHQCYPPAVNYTPLYYLFNGVAFDKTSFSTTTPGTSLFAASPASGVTGNVLVRFVNAGLRMHVPSIVGANTGASAVPGFSLIAEDGNVLPGVPRVQSEVFLAAGKTYDVMVNVPASTATALPVFDRELSLSSNATSRDSGMLAYISINGAAAPSVPAFTAAVANPDSYSVVSGNTLTVSDPSKGVLANDVNVFGAQLLAPVTGLTLNTDGTFTYTGVPTTFTYCGNGALTGAACATVTLGAATIEAASGITVVNDAYTSTVATSLGINAPGVLLNDSDAAGYPLTVNVASVAPIAGLTLSVDKSGAFKASIGGCTLPAGCPYTFTYKAQNSQGTVSSAAATVTITFPASSGLAVTVLDGTDKVTKITDYRWVIEEDRSFYVDPTKTTNNGGTAIVPTFGTNFHTSYMPLVATGCTGALSCESGQSVLGVPSPAQTIVFPSSVQLDPTKRYYISVLPGDAGNPFHAGNLTADCTNGVAKATNPGACGHGMGGAPILFPAANTAVTILTQPDPFPPSKLSVFVFEDDFPLNGEQDGGGGVDVLSPNEPGLGGFNITLFDDAGGTGDATGQMTYDMFNQPLVNSLSGTPDPSNGNVDACPISANARSASDPTSTGITGTIVTCPKYEADNTTLSPLAGQAVIANLMPGRYGVVATPGADRIGRGEEWLQTNTLDGQKAHDSFLRIGEPSFFQEFGPAGYHVSIGFANPSIISKRITNVCNGTDPTITGTNCHNSVTGKVTTERMSRTPDERLYSSGDNSSFGFTQCYVSFGDPDGEDFAFAKCAGDGTFNLSGLPDGDWRLTVFDQWNDMLVDGLSTPVRLAGGALVNMGDIATNQWQANIYTSTFFDANGNGVREANEQGLTLVPTNIRFRDGSYSNFNNTDLAGNAGFNEVFPLFSWYVVESDITRYKSTGTHVVYDAGGPADGTCTTSTAPCGSSAIAANMANTAEQISVPAALRVPGAVYCANADCTGSSIATGPIIGGSSGPTTGLSTGRVDPPWAITEGWQGFSGQNSFLEFGKKPYAVGENGGIHGEVTYASTRPFDDPALLIHTSWTPNVPGVTINLYQEGTAPDGTKSLKLVDTTVTTSWDAWAQGFRTDGNPNMNCPGQGKDTGPNADIFFFTLFNQPMWLDVLANGGTPAHTLPANSQFKCFDGMHNWNQLQPAPFDGMYSFPSVTSINPTTGRPATTNCRACIPDPDTTDPYRSGLPMLPKGTYVVEMIVPPGYELVKEEDKNILIGDNYIAPVTQEFPGLGGAIYILPDQAELAAAYNANNAQNSTNALGRTILPSHEGDTGSVETFWPCVGASRTVPDFISLFPQSGEVAPFAGATRNLCDRKEVTLDDQTAALAKFWVFTSAHVAAHFTGVITDDFTSEFDPFSPQFGEKFSPPNMPVSIKDWTGTEISRVYADQWGTYNGMTYSTWEVNPPNPTGYAPTMMVTCMNDPGPIPGPNGTLVTDPLYNPQYSQFCYEIPFMPGQTQYMDTPVVPTSAFAGAGYNNPDCAYAAGTPAVKEVDGDGIGPWVSASGHTLTITSLGVQTVPNNAYSGPSATAPPYNAKTITKNYGFGATAGTVALVGRDGIVRPLTGVSWGDTTITGTVPANVPACPIQQQVQYLRGTAASTALCGELVITAANGKQSVDTVTVTIGGQAPTHVAATDSIQTAIDKANPGDLIIIDPTCTTTAACTALTRTQAAHNELLLMWKPVRLQGVGAASSVINANTHPAGKLDAWRLKVNCLFGLAPSGTPNGYTSACGSGWTEFRPTANNPQIDRLPLEATVGWDATLNGNLAELLQEPTLMGALEGAAITVLSKGVTFPSNPFASDIFPVGTQLLTNGSNPNRGCGPNNANAHNRFPSNFWCNPSSIDGLGITDSSQGGGGIFVHAWGHNIQIANNRVNNNSGTLSGGISIGQGEFPPQYLRNGATPNADPGSCNLNANGGNLGGLPTNTQEPYCFNLYVNVHHNAITSNSSTGDELFSATPAGAGGVSFCNGADYYKFNYNWVCGNLSSGDGGGVAHIGFSYNGDIEHNTFLFNQSTNPTIPTNGGALLVMGAPDVDPPCSTVDQDCLSAPNLIGPSDGTGPGMVINANMMMGNAAESGSGGGLRLQNINGSEVVNFPTRPSSWYSVTVTNNIIADNVAGWDGAGVSLQDALAVNFVNNTVMSNDSTASSGVLFNTFGAPLASSSGPTCPSTGCGTTSAPQPAGLVSVQNSAILTANLPATITCPAGHFSGLIANNGTCRKASYPLIANDVFWQNRSFYIGVGALGAGTLNQQNVVTLYNSFSGTPGTTAASQTTTGQCVSGANYWDIGVRGDTGPGNHASTVTLTPTYSVLTNTSENGLGSNNLLATNPAVVSQYCNGSRTPPEFKSAGYQVPPGISDATVPNPVFNLTPAATVDEGNNWINISWGPLSLTNPVTGATLGNYALAPSSLAIDRIPSSVSHPSTDFFGNARPDPADLAHFDIGAVEFQGTGTGGGGTPTATVSPSPLAFGNQAIGTPSGPRTLTVTNTGTVALAGGSFTFGGGTPQPFSRAGLGQGGTCGTTLAVGASCTFNVVFTPATGTVNGTAFSRTLTVAYTGAAVTGSPVTLTGTGVTPGTLSFTAATNATLGTFFGVRTLTFTIPAPRAPVTSVVTVTNTGAGSLQVTAESIALPGTNFSQTGTTCSFTTPLAPGGTCTISVSYATPATRPPSPSVNALSVSNNGSGTMSGVTPLALSGQ